MLTHDQVATLRDISQSIAFADDRRGAVEQLSRRVCDEGRRSLYELTPKGLRAVEDHPTKSGAS